MIFEVLKTKGNGQTQTYFLEMDLCSLKVKQSYTKALIASVTRILA